MQIVYLSARPSLLRETLEHVAHFAPFLDDVVVITPEAMREEIMAIPRVDTVLTDEELCELPTWSITALAHTSRNYLLRARAASHPAVAEHTS